MSVIWLKDRIMIAPILIIAAYDDKPFEPSCVLNALRDPERRCYHLPIHRQANALRSAGLLLGC